MTNRARNLIRGFAVTHPRDDMDEYSVEEDGRSWFADRTRRFSFLCVSSSVLGMRPAATSVVRQLFIAGEWSANAIRELGERDQADGRDEGNGHRRKEGR